MTSRPGTAHRLFARLYFLQRIWEPLGLARHRRGVARGVAGRALEVGVGTGFSLPYYATAPAAACDPNLTMLRIARRRARRLNAATSFVAARAEALPFRPGAFDTVVTQNLLCSVDDPGRAAREIHRVLARDGHLRSVEHGIAERPGMARWQRTITPLWRRLVGGCRLDRDVITPYVDAGLIPARVRRCSGGSVVRGTYDAREQRAEATG